MASSVIESGIEMGIIQIISIPLSALTVVHREDETAHYGRLDGSVLA